ncbi:MAG: HD family phosphohydrolase, partial [Bdellovibrionaceae bacterium]|nr:HD family phosphohydrolase [Pseudobdellovibrionaceae bacterium]
MHSNSTEVHGELDLKGRNIGMLRWGKGADNKGTKSARSRYEDPSHNFSDWVNQLWIERTLLGRILLDLDQKYFARRVAIVLAFCGILGWLIFFQISIPHDFQVGEVVNVDVLSPMSFEMVDEITTEDKRRKEEAKVPLIFDFDPDVYGRVLTGIEKSFRMMREHGRELSKRGRVSDEEKLRYYSERRRDMEKILESSLQDYIFAWLVDAGFSSKIETALKRVLESWYEKRIGDTSVLSSKGNTELMARVISRGGEGEKFRVPLQDVLDISNSNNLVLPDLKMLQKFSEAERLNILTLARDVLKPNLTLNLRDSQRARDQVRQSVLPVTLSYKKGQVIMPKGTTIQGSHMAVLKQVEVLQSQRRRNLMSFSMAVLLAVTLFVFAAYLRRFSNRLQVSFKDLFVMMMIAMGVVLVTKIYLFLMQAALGNRIEAIPAIAFLYAAPVAAGPMLVGLLIASGEVVWIYTAFQAVCLGIMEDFNFGFALVSLVGGVAAARGVFTCRTRNDIY